ncbi:hypothetical protein [Nocardia cyriacigeorgica]|nr:hypothetical protein [Nocardia cyriacigeorgica]
MIAGTPVLDLDDAESLEAADSRGALRSAPTRGAQNASAPGLSGPAAAP